MGNLNPDKSFEELKEGISKFFKKEGLVIQDVRVGGSRWVVYTLALNYVYTAVMAVIYFLCELMIYSDGRWNN